MKVTKKPIKKPFYHQLVRADRIYLYIKRFSLPTEKEKEILDLVEETIYTRAIDAVLEKLPQGKHEEFMSMFIQDPGSKAILDFLKKEAVDIENYIQRVFRQLEEEILEDILASLQEE